MTAAQLAVQRVTRSRGFEEDSDLPAEVGRRIVRGVLLRDVPDDRLPALGELVHWTYGSLLGVGLGVAAADRDPEALRTGLAFGAVVWVVSLVEMPGLRLADPVWRLSPREVVPDLAYHLLYGVAAAAALRAAVRRQARERPGADDDERAPAV